MPHSLLHLIRTSGHQPLCLGETSIVLLLRNTKFRAEASYSIVQVWKDSTFFFFAKFSELWRELISFLEVYSPLQGDFAGSISLSPACQGCIYGIAGVIVILVVKG
jgi:hypothetical protein